MSRIIPLFASAAFLSPVPKLLASYTLPCNKTKHIFSPGNASGYYFNPLGLEECPRWQQQTPEGPNPAVSWHLPAHHLHCLQSWEPHPPVVHKAAAPHTPHTSRETTCAWNYTRNFPKEFVPQGACKAMVDAGCAGRESLLLVLLHTATGQGAFSSCIPLRIITTRDCFSPLLRYFWCNFSFLICIHFDSAGVGAVFGADDKELCFFSSHCKWSLAGDFKNNAEIYFINSRFCLPPIIQLYENYQV